MNASRLFLRAGRGRGLEPWVDVHHGGVGGKAWVDGYLCPTSILHKCFKRTS